MNHLKADLERLLPSDSEPSERGRARALVRGLVSPGFQAILFYRTFRWVQQAGIPGQPLRFILERITEATTGIQIPIGADIGPGLRIHHFGGIIIHPGAVIGARCTLHQGVTIGAVRPGGGAPRIGTDCFVGAGAKILGAIHLGDRCQVGANAVVLESFPDDAVLVGVPARNVRQKNPPV